MENYQVNALEPQQFGLPRNQVGVEGEFFLVLTYLICFSQDKTHFPETTPFEYLLTPPLPQRSSILPAAHITTSPSTRMVVFTHGASIIMDR